MGVLKESSRLRWKVGINGEFLEWSFGGDFEGRSVKRVDLLGDFKYEDLIVKNLSMFGENEKVILLNA